VAVSRPREHTGILPTGLIHCKRSYEVASFSLAIKLQYCEMYICHDTLSAVGSISGKEGRFASAVIGAREKVSILSLHRASVRMSSGFLTHPYLKYIYLDTSIYYT